MLLHMAKFQSFYWWVLFSCIFIHTISSFFIHLMVDTQVASISCLLLECWYHFKFFFFWINTQKWNFGVIWQFYFQFFEESSYFISIVAAPFSQPVHEVSLFSTLLPMLVICGLFDDSHSDRCQVILHCGFNLSCSDDTDGKHLFMCLQIICMSSLEKCLWVSVLLLILFCIFNVDLQELFVYFGY